MYQQLPNVILYCELITVHVTQHQLLIAREVSDLATLNSSSLCTHLWM